MKNRDWKRIILLVCSIAAMVLACMPNSVTVYMNSPEGEPIVAKVSYLTLVEDVKTGIALPTAVLVAGVNLTLVSIFVARKKQKLLTAIKITSLLGAGLTVLPVMIRSEEVTLLPNMLVPIALMVVFFDAYNMAKKAEKTNKPKKSL